MNINFVEKPNSQNNSVPYNSHVSSMLGKFMQSQFQSVLSRFQNSGSSSSNPLQQILNFSRMMQNTPTQQVVHKPKITTAQVQQAVQEIKAEVTPEVRKPQMKPSGQGPQEIQDIVQRASQEHGVPVALINAVIKQESNFKCNATSHCGAQGLMQLMPGTAKDMGVSNAYDAEDNVMGGTKYLRKMLDRYEGDVTLALAAYNAGPGNVRKYGNKVPPFKETQNYVKKVGNYYEANLASVRQTSQKFAGLESSSTNKASS